MLRSSNLFNIAYALVVLAALGKLLLYPTEQALVVFIAFVTAWNVANIVRNAIASIAEVIDGFRSKDT